MKITRVYADNDGESHFENVEIDLKAHKYGFMSTPVEASGVVFRKTGAGHDLNWHNAPRRQYVVVLGGGVLEVEVSDGHKREFTPGDILLMEDTNGKGHISKETSESGMTSLFITLD